MADSKPVSLDEYRKRRAGWEAPARAVEPLKPVFLAAEAGKVVVRFSDGREVELSPASADTWSEQLAQMARTARDLAGEGGDDAG